MVGNGSEGHVGLVERGLEKLPGKIPQAKGQLAGCWKTWRNGRQNRRDSRSDACVLDR